MAHKHLHFHDDVSTEATHGKQVRVSIALLGTLTGGMLLISSGISRFFYGGDHTEFLALAGAILLGYAKGCEEGCAPGPGWESYGCQRVCEAISYGAPASLGLGILWTMTYLKLIPMFINNRTRESMHEL